MKKYLLVFTFCHALSFASCGGGGGGGGAGGAESLASEREYVAPSPEVRRLYEPAVPGFSYDHDGFDCLTTRHGHLTVEYKPKQAGEEEALFQPSNSLNLCNMIFRLLRFNDGSAGTRVLPTSMRRLNLLYTQATGFYNIVKLQKPSAILGLGRLPSMFMDFVKAVHDSNDEKPEGLKELLITSVAFSGCHDVDSLNHTSVAGRGESYKRDLSTPDRRAAFFAYLDVLGLHEIHGEIFLLESITSGSGLNAFMRILRAYYIEKARPFPALRFISLDNMKGANTKTFHAKSGELEFLSGNELDGYMPMTIPTSYLKLEHSSIIGFGAVPDN